MKDICYKCVGFKAKCPDFDEKKTECENFLAAEGIVECEHCESGGREA